MAAEKEWVYGFHAVQTLLKTKADCIEELLLQRGRRDQRLKKLLSLAEAQDVPYRWASRSDLEQRASSNNHQGIVAGCVLATGEPLANESYLDQILQTLTGPALFLVLDEVTDPHNLGACLRTADAAGVDAVITTRDRSVGITPVVRKVACGAAETVPFVMVTNLARTLRMLREQGVWLVGTDGSARQSLYELDVTGPVALIMGAEGTGLRRLTRETCDHLVHLPMEGAVDSLNVSVAAGVCLYEIVRQRKGRH